MDMNLSRCFNIISCALHEPLTLLLFTNVPLLHILHIHTANAKIHRETTGPEIWRDTDGKLDMYISGVGTGGTVTGVSQFIKGCPEHGCEPLKPDLYTVAVEPQEQMLLTEAKGGSKIGEQGPHKIQGRKEH